MGAPEEATPLLFRDDLPFGAHGGHKYAEYPPRSLLDRRREPPSRRVRDHVLYAVGAHVVSRYGEVGSKNRPVGGLAPWQQRRAEQLSARYMLGTHVSAGCHQLSVGAEELTATVASYHCAIGPIFVRETNNVPSARSANNFAFEIPLG